MNEFEFIWIQKIMTRSRFTFNLRRKTSKTTKEHRYEIRHGQGLTLYFFPINLGLK